MKSKAASFEEETDYDRCNALIRDGLKELAAIHKENKAADAEIRELRSATRKTLDRIRQNLEYVEAAR